ncbi:MAG: hypothetical protein AAF663_00390 [Planctomycetota bacterium]
MIRQIRDTPRRRNTPPDTVHRVADHCPACGSTELHCYGSVDQGDGSRRRYITCLGCRHSFKLVLEPPEIS